MSCNTRKGSVKVVTLPQVHDPRGDLTFVEGRRHVPFNIARVYYLYNVPVDSERGGHAHKELEQVIFALSHQSSYGANRSVVECHLDALREREFRNTSF